MVSKTVEASFPSNIERSVASALLSLSSCPSVGFSGDDSGSPESLESTAISALRSFEPPAEAEASVDEELSSAQQVMVVAFVSGSHDLKLKIVQKKRSKSIYISNGKKLKTSKPEPTPAPVSSETVSEITTEASSCISSGSSGQSLRSKTSAGDNQRKPVIPSHMGHKAAAILRVLADGSASEVMIRQLLGDSPSTSKALRMLLKLQAVRRFGAGGRFDPYIYTGSSISSAFQEYRGKSSRVRRQRFLQSRRHRVWIRRDLKMASTQQGSSIAGGRRGSVVGKVEKASRRSWSPAEEASLMASLKELVANGWKSDNGFRGGYLTRLEDAIAKDFPGTDIKGTPNISSKLQGWKKNYGSLTLMLSRSGVGWNAKGDYTIDCDDEQWAQIQKVDKNAKSMRHRPWPMYEDWQLVFGMDRATGESAEDMVDAVNNMMNDEPPFESGQHFDETEVTMDDVSVNDAGGNSSSRCEQERVGNQKPPKGKKRKADTDNLVFAIQMFCEISRGTNDRLEMVASRVGYDFDVDKAKREAYSLLENIPGLTLREKFAVTDILCDQMNRLLVFKDLPDDNHRVEYVHHLLNTNK